ncbi:VOC family protein [Pleurocapsales cyanobacterium LEGE 10410]|nr:VOC family protein [Pleurocapsales cyanobacterium LEGE 10410]
MITGLNHLTLSVSDLEISFNFYKDILGCKPLAKWKRGAYLLAGDLWLCLSLNANGEGQVSSKYTHYAFSLSPENFEYYSQNLEQLELKLWQDNTSEGDSLYILDPDNYKLELHVGNWQTRLAAIKHQPYQDLIFFD